MARKIRMGMVGGGRGAFIGAVHRMAAQLDGQIELVCGAFSSDAERSRASGGDLFLPAERCYGSYTEMVESEAARPEGDCMDFVSIVTPNHLHHSVATASLEAGFHVMCDKPMTRTVEEARDLVETVERTGQVFGLSHNYTGYPMVKEARHLVREGRLGTLRKIVVEYPQGWLATALEQTGQKQADWRTDPERAGAAGCMGDIGTHAENLVEYVTGLEIESLCADLTTFVDGRRLDDDGSVLVRFDGGARGVLYASQVSIDEENALAIRVYGDQGGLEWHQEEPNTLLLKWQDRPREILRTGANYAHLAPETLGNTRLPAGHPEGFLEAFANLYRNFADAVRRHRAGDTGGDPDVPNARDGLRGMLFIDAVVRSSTSDQKWVTVLGS